VSIFFLFFFPLPFPPSKFYSHLVREIQVHSDCAVSDDAASDLPGLSTCAHCTCRDTRALLEVTRVNRDEEVEDRFFFSLSLSYICLFTFGLFL
jgi:hypothetical protein